MIYCKLLLKPTVEKCMVFNSIMQGVYLPGVHPRFPDIYIYIYIHIARYIVGPGRGGAGEGARLRGQPAVRAMLRTSVQTL